MTDHTDKTPTPGELLNRESVLLLMPGDVLSHPEWGEAIYTPRDGDDGPPVGPWSFVSRPDHTDKTAPEGERLLPCPFCGGPVELERPADRPRRSGPDDWWGVICRNTENLGGSCALSIAPSRSKASAIARWNRRATPSRMASDAPAEGVGEATVRLLMKARSAIEAGLATLDGLGVNAGGRRALMRQASAEITAALQAPPADHLPDASKKVADPVGGVGEAVAWRYRFVTSTDGKEWSDWHYVARTTQSQRTAGLPRQTGGGA
jgi:hypothetical protein